MAARPSHRWTPEEARGAGRKGVAVRAASPKCGAKRKHDGGPCQREATENGRCRIHGGLTPKGDDWHCVQWPKNGKGQGRKLERKLADMERRQKRLAARLAAMTPAEREKYDAWHRTHQAGAALARAAKRVKRQQANEARRVLSQAKPAATVTEEMARILKLQKDLEARRDELEAARLFGNVFD